MKERAPEFKIVDLTPAVGSAPDNTTIGAEVMDVSEEIAFKHRQSDRPRSNRITSVLPVKIIGIAFDNEFTC